MVTDNVCLFDELYVEGLILLLLFLSICLQLLYQLELSSVGGLQIFQLVFGLIFEGTQRVNLLMFVVFLGSQAGNFIQALFKL